MKPQNKPITQPADKDVTEADLQSAGVGVGLMPEKVHEEDLVKTQEAQEEAKGQGTEVPPLEPPATPTAVISGNSV
jgi:hypothetical protein